MNTEPVNIALIGLGKRAINLYLPILRKLNRLINLTCVCNRSEDKAKKISAEEKVPYYLKIKDILKNEKIDLAILSVSRDNHLEPALELIESGTPVLLETPLAEKQVEMDNIINSAEKNKVIVEVAENYYRRPKEILKQKLIKEGFFGKINFVYSNFAGHGYHGISMIRSLFDFNVKPVNVTGFRKEFGVKKHLFRKGLPEKDTEELQHGIIEFDNGSLGFYNFTSLTYGSPMRIEQTKNEISFYAEKGMGKGDELIVLKGTDKKIIIEIEKKTINRDSNLYLDKYIAHSDHDIIWDNPLKEYFLNDNEIEIGLCILDIINAVKNKIPLKYGIHNAKIDRLTELAMIESWSNKNKKVEISDNMHLKF